MKKEWSEQALMAKAESYCALTERCVAEVEAKLKQWGATLPQAERVVAHLLKEKYVDQTRYCRAFVRDKYRFNQWGRVKIAQALYLKKMPEALIAVGMEEIDESAYEEILTKMLTQKMKSVKADSDYERVGKLIRFAVGRGFEMEVVLRCVKRIGLEDASLD